MTRGVLYITWPGDPRTDAMLARSIASLQATNPGLAFQAVSKPSGTTFLDRPAIYAASPFDETLCLDADTVVMGDLSHGFDRARQFGLACCVCECPWGRRYPSIAGDVVEYNAGALWITRRTRPLLARWQELNRTIDSSITWGAPARTMPYNDQAGLALAIDQLGINPYVLPLNWNFRPIWHKAWFGPLKIWHDYSDVPPQLAERNASAAPMDFFRLA